MPKPAAGTEREMDGVEKAATLLIALGPEKSAQIFKHLKEEEIEQLTLEIANTSSVSPQTKEQVLNEFYEICLAQQYIAEGGISYAKELLEKALGEDKARDVIGKLTASLQVRPFEFIRKTDSTQLLNFIQDEHPQTIALILSYLPAAQASNVVSALPPEKQADVAKRIAMMDRTSPDVIKQVERYLKENSHLLLIRITLSLVVLMQLLKFLILLTEEQKSILWRLLKLKSQSLQMKSVRRCSYSKIFFLLITELYRESSGMLIIMTLHLRLRGQQKRYRMLFLITFHHVLLL